MGGKKKPTISQLEKRMMREAAAKAGKQEEGGFKPKLTSKGTLSASSIDEIYRGIANQPCVTPYLVASMFGLKISAAKQVLKDLESRGLLRLVDANRRVRVYVPAAQAAS